MDLRLESSPVGYLVRFLFQTNENICDGPLMTCNESSSFLHFKNLEVQLETHSSFYQVSTRLGLAELVAWCRKELSSKKSSMMLTNKWVNKEETGDCIGKHNKGYIDGKRLREDTLTLSLSLYTLYLVACPQRFFKFFVQFCEHEARISHPHPLALALDKAPAVIPDFHSSARWYLKRK